MFESQITHDPAQSLKQALDQAIVSVILINQRNEITYFNAAAERLWGYTARQVLGKNVKMLIPSEMRSDHDDWVDKHRTSGVDRIVGSCRDVQIETRDGQRPWVSLALSKVVQDNGELHYTALVRDITVERSTRTAFQQTLEQSADAVVSMDAANIVTFFNAAAESLWGRNRSEVIGKTVHLLAPPGSPAAADAPPQDDTHALPFTHGSETTITRSDGSEHHVAVSMSRIMLDDGTKTHTAFLKDMTKHRQMSGALDLVNDLLGQIDRLNTRIDSISRMTNLLSVNASIEAARAGTAGAGFGVVAHEIRALAGEASTISTEIDDLVAHGRTSVRDLSG